MTTNTTEITRVFNVCYKCGYQWAQHKYNKPSPICPNCRTHKWQGITQGILTIKINTCHRCGHKWKNHKNCQVSSMCPHCRTIFWNIDKRDRRGDNYFKVCGLRQSNPQFTLLQIANLLGISKERVRQLLNNAHLPTRGTKA